MRGMKLVFRLVSLLCLVACLAGLAWLGLARDVRQQSLASTRRGDWDKFWRQSDAAPLIKMPGGLLPSVIPGPADAWAGGRPHAVRVEFHAEPGEYIVELLFNETHDTAPPVLRFSVNGRERAKVQAAAGQGQPGPYERFNPALTMRAVIVLDQADNVLTITNEAGSWVAPSRLRLLRGVGFYPARLAWELLARPALLWGLAGLLLAAVFFWIWASRGLAWAAGATALLGLSSLLLVTCAELLFRQYLILAPQARNLAAQHGAQAPDHRGTSYTYATMIQPNPDLEIIYNLKPNLDGYFAKHPLKTNAYSMRGPAVEPTAAPGVLRVMGLGDSVMFGWGVSHQDSALTRVGQALAQRLGQPVETLNLGCPSYNTANEVAVYRKMGRRFQPKLVLLIFMQNDFGFPGLMLEPVRPWTLERSYILRQLRLSVAPLWRDAVTDADQFVSTRHLDDIREKKPHELTAEEKWRQRVSAHYAKTIGQDAVAAGLDDLAAMLRADGAYGLVVYNPICIELGRPETYEKEAVFVTQAARKAGLAAVDMTPIYEDYLKKRQLNAMSQALWVGEKDWHPNATAHELIAQAVVEKLAEKGIIAAMAKEGRSTAPPDK